jgi:hypothetical protein
MISWEAVSPSCEGELLPSEPVHVVRESKGAEVGPALERDGHRLETPAPKWQQNSVTGRHGSLTVMQR